MNQKKNRLHAMVIENTDPKQACGLVLDTCKKIASDENIPVATVLLQSINNMLMKSSTKVDGMKEDSKLSYNFTGADCVTIQMLHGATCLYLDELKLKLTPNWGAM